MPPRADQGQAGSDPHDALEGLTTDGRPADDRRSSVTATLEAALACAARGWHVFPCGPDKRPLTEHGFLDAVTDPAAVRAMWKTHPAASVAVATGASGLVVVDLDCKNGQPGLDEWKKIVAASQEPLEATTLVETPSGGMHVYYRANGHKVGTTAGRLAPGIDTRAEGGYVIAAGSPGYLYVDDHGPDHLQTMPAELAKLIEYTPAKPAAPTSGAIPEGRRDSTLASLAGTMRHRGLSEDAIYAALAAENKTSCKPPLPDAQVRKIAGSVARYEPATTVPPEQEPAPPVRFYTVPELADLPETRVEWILKGLWARGMLTQVTGPPKEGKTTFLGAGAAAVAEGREFIGLATTKTAILYYTEEGRQTFVGMMRRVCAADAANIHVLLRSQTFGRSWPDVCEAIRAYRAEHDIGLVIVDTFTDLAGLAGEDENVSGPVLKAIGCLRPIADDGAAVVIVRHDRKEGGSLLESGRGSSAFAGAVDVLMALRKKGEMQREVIALGRPEGVPDSIFVTFDGIEYSAADDPRRKRDLALERTLLAVLPREEGQAIGVEDVATLIGRSAKTATKELKRLHAEGAVHSGRGKGKVASHQAIGWWAP